VVVEDVGPPALFEIDDSIAADARVDNRRP